MISLDTFGEGKLVFEVQYKDRCNYIGEYSYKSTVTTLLLIHPSKCLQTDSRGQAQMRLRCQLGAGLTLPPAAPRCREQVARESEYESKRSSTLINNRCGEAVVKGDICELR